MLAEAIVLLILGLAFVIAEVFFVSMGLLSLIAALFILGADLLAFREGQLVGWIFVGVEIVLVPLLVVLAFRILPRLPFGRRMLLSGPVSEPTSGSPAQEHLVGMEGTALTDLRPAGMALLGEERLSVVALGGLVPKGSRIAVVNVEGTEVRVRALEMPPEESF